VNAAGAIALDEAQLKLVRRVLDDVVPGARVAVFGSRATGHARPFSDLDLLLIEPSQLSWVQRADLRDAFDKSSLPFKVDLVEVAGLSAGIAQRAHSEARPLP
jgi:uncharacterized protein